MPPAEPAEPARGCALRIMPCGAPEPEEGRVELCELREKSRQLWRVRRRIWICKFVK